MQYWDASDWFMAFLVVVLVALVGFCVFALIVNVFTPTVCNAQAAQLGLESRWSFMAGCYVNTPEMGWWPLDEYIRAINVR